MPCFGIGGDVAKSQRYSRPEGRVRIAVLGVFAMLAMTCLLASQASAMSVEELKSRITRAASGLKDVSFTLTVVEKNVDAIEKVDPNFARLYDFKTAKLFLKEPDKLRIEGKLGMVKFEYIINGGRKIVRAPLLKIRKESDYAGNPGKLNDALDFGIVAPSMWAMRRIEMVNDPAATANGEIKIRLRWSDAAMSILLWLDNKDLSLKRMEKRDGDDKVKVVLTYSNHKKPDGVAWIPTRLEMTAPDGTKVGVSEITDIKVNAGLADSMFK